MKRTMSMILAVIIAIGSLTAVLALSVFAESLYIRKIVSVVYDDSGSMKDNDKWIYANYAMQTFCGMLNGDDELFITYMSDLDKGGNESAEIDLSSGGIQKSVDYIGSHTDTGRTPYDAVVKAYNKLKSVKDSNENTQYWLVVITDGSFNDYEALNNDDQKEKLNEHFTDYTEEKMPNGTFPQVTFLGIGNIVFPDDEPGKGIYTYSASDAVGIIDAMSKMADRISGRTRLDKSSIKMTDDHTVLVSSSVPLLNMAVFTQGETAKITKAIHDNETEIPISRSVSLKAPRKAELVGSAYLLGDSQKVIGSGTYSITFDQKVKLDDVIILFEPALEMRMTVTLNGKEIKDLKELENAYEEDKISVSCKIYEMGTDTEIDPSLLPPDTKSEITVFENGEQIGNADTEGLMLSEYILKNVKTEITSSVTIKGFNPVKRTLKFEPKKIAYTVTPSFGSKQRSVKINDIADNKELTVCFTVSANGKEITEPERVKSLNPKITVSPDGNSGEVTYSDDGKIVFTPQIAAVTTSDKDSIDVKVTCDIGEDATASETYTVLLSDYEVVSAGASGNIKKTGFFNNTVSAAFYITKDGTKLGKAQVEGKMTSSLNEQYKSLKMKVTVEDDGTVKVTPYTEEEHKITFWSWWTNWAYYFGLEGDDVEVTLSHSYGTAQCPIEVVEESWSYRILYVFIPLAIEAVALILLATWIILVVTKPRYLKNATLYVGDIRYNPGNGTHTLRNFSAIGLAGFNKIKRGNGRLKFKKTADVVSADGVKIRADRGGRIICEMRFPWYKGRIEPVGTGFENLSTPSDISDYIMRHKRLEINEFATTETVEGDFNRGLLPVAHPTRAKYIVVPDSVNGTGIVNNKRVIRTGKLFIYVNQ